MQEVRSTAPAGRRLATALSAARGRLCCRELCRAHWRMDVAVEVIVGFVGVLVGSLTTSALTIYKERFASRHELAVRDLQYERQRRAERDVFQRDSVLALQAAVTDLMKAVHHELDRMLRVAHETGRWPSRTWETPTAVGWSAAVLELESARARVFDDELRSLADQLRTVAGESVWAGSLEAAQERSERLEPLSAQLNAAVMRILPALY
jgi:hypothetical protein